MTFHVVPTIALLGGAVVLLALAGALAARGWRQRRTAMEVDQRAIGVPAEVVELTAKDVSVAGEPTTFYYPTVRFRPQDGLNGVDGEVGEVVAECLTGVRPPPPHVGDRVEVRYDPAHPDRVELADSAPTASAGRTSFLLARFARTGALGLAVAWLLLAVLFWR